MTEQTRIFYQRHLPHWQPPGATMFFTWRLFGSLPKTALIRLVEERELLEKQMATREILSPRERALLQGKRLFALMDTLLVENMDGPHWLAEALIAQLVRDAFFHYDGDWYTLLSFVLMPNHVHLMLTPLPVQTAADISEPQYVPIARITKSLKGYTAREANKLLHRTGHTFWQEESYDHWARDDAEAARIVSYIESDPVRSGLVHTLDDWRWSSVWERKKGNL
ncbi:MAG: transposase [Anaerolineae bacterium]|nr:transposase [Anaerolineae bacterium]